MQEYARVYKSVQEYARVCKSVQEYAKVCKSMQEYAIVCTVVYINILIEIQDTVYREIFAVKKFLRLSATTKIKRTNFSTTK